MQDLELPRLNDCRPWIILKYGKDGEDVFQDTCVRYCERIRKDPQWHAGYGAIKKIALSAFIDRKRKQSTVTSWRERQQHEEKHSRPLPPKHCPQEKQCLTEELMEILNSAIQGLRPEYAKVITKQFFDGLTIQEIADQSSIPKNTVRSWRTRALEQLKTVLQRSEYSNN